MGARNLLLGAFFFLNAYFAVSSASCPLSSVSTPQLSISPLFSVLALSFLISFLVIAIGVMISKIVPQTNLGEWLKNEYWEITKSAILIAGVIGFMIFIGNISLLLINQHPTTVYGIEGIQYTINTINNVSENSICTIYSDVNKLLGEPNNNALSPLSPGGLIVNLGVIKSITVGWYIPLPLGFGAFTFGSKFKIYNNPMLESASTGQFESIINDTMNFLYLPVMLTLAFLYETLPIIIFIGVMIFIPMGVIFRAFPFLRPIGGTLFAFGIGLSIVLPMLIILIDVPTTSMVYNMLYQPPQTPSGLYGIISTILRIVAAPLVDIGDSIAAVISIYPALNAFVPLFLFLFLQLGLLTLDLMIWYPLVNSIAKSLGGSIRLSIGGRLKIA